MDWLVSQPTVVSVGRFRVAGKAATFPQVSERSMSLCIGKFQEFGACRPIFRASLWSRIFTIPILIAETRFEITETGSISAKPRLTQRGPAPYA